MKFKSQQLIGIALGLVPLSAYSQQTVQNVTFALTSTWEDAALTAKDESGKVIPGEDPVWENNYSVESSTKSTTTYEEGSKLVSEKIGNKQILEFLVDEGVIDDPAGYSISLIQNTELVGKNFDDDEDDEDEGDLEHGFYLTKKDMEPIDISGYIYISDENGDVSSESMKKVQTITGDKESWAVTGKSSGKLVVELSFDFPANGIFGSMSGVVNWSDTLKSFGSGEDQFYAWMPNSAKFNSVAGYNSVEDDDEEELIEGSISIGAGSILP